MSVPDIQSLTKQNENLTYKVESLEKSILNTQRSLFRIEQGLFGDEDISHSGAIKDLKDLRNLYVDIAARVESMRIVKLGEDTLLKNNKFWLVTIASAVGGIIMWGLNLLLKFV